MVKEYGPVKEVIPKYEAFLNRWKDKNKVKREAYRTKALNYQQKILNGKAEKKMPPFWIEDDTELEDEYRETLVSRLGQIKPSDAMIYSHRNELEQKKTAKEFLNQVYYMKKRGNLNEEPFYLLSVEKSIERGTIGWIKAKDLKSYLHLEIDHDPKT